MFGQFDTMPASRSGVRLNNVMSEIGNATFESTLLYYLYDCCGSDQIFTAQCAQGQLSDIVSMQLGDPLETGSANKFKNPYWKIDPLLDFCTTEVVGAAPLFHRQDSLDLPRGLFRRACLDEMQFRDRVLICGREGNVAGSTLTLLLIKSVGSGTFSNRELAGLEPMAEILIAVLDRHNWVKRRRRAMGTALASIDEIEQRCRVGAGFPRREAEVCARTVSGLTTKAVAHELRLGEQTVLTYRKRIYHRLRISSHQELVQWYLRLWVEEPERCRPVPVIIRLRTH